MTLQQRTARRIVIALGVLLIAPAAQADLPPSCVSFTDSPLVAGSTVIKAAHLTELRQCVTDLRAQKSLAAPSWTDPVIVPQQTPVKAAHVTEMRTALNEVYAAAGQQPPTYTPVPVAGVTMVAAAHFNELRSAAQSAPQGPCQVELTPDAYPGVAPVSGGTGSFAVTTSCSWSAVSSTSWLTVTPTSGTGNQMLEFAVAANTSGTRSAYIDVGNGRFTVTQGGTGTTGELIVNGHFESGFIDATSPVEGRVAAGWSPHEGAYLLAEAGVPSDGAQAFESAGMSQWVTMPPNQAYLLTADVDVNGGTVWVYIDKAGGGLPTWREMTNGGGRRVRLEFWHDGPYQDDNVQVSIWGSEGGEFSVDDVSLRPLAEVTADERVLNGGFDTFEYYNDGQSAGYLGSSWTRFGTSSSAVTFSQEGSFNGAQQFIQYANAGDGIGQNVTVVPGQRYHLRASITGWAGSAKLGIGPVGSPATHSVGWCGGGGIAHTLSLIYTPPVGQTSVTVSVAGDWAPGDAAFYVDDVSLMPTALTYVEPGAPQGECVPRHTVTFTVHDAVTNDPIEGALVEIEPAWGSGPARVTYPDGTISYPVGAGQLTYSVSVNGYFPHFGVLDVQNSQTASVSLDSSSDPTLPPLDPGGGPPTIPEFPEVLEPVSQGSASLGTSIPPAAQTTWTVLVNGSDHPDAIPDWMVNGSPEFNEIAATYGPDPLQHHWRQSALWQVAPPFYVGIDDGAEELAAVIESLPPGDVNVIAHSHGGNVAIQATWLLQRPIRHLLNLGTPVNSDMQRYTKPGIVLYRCLVSSWSDWIQFGGASPGQIRDFSRFAIQSSKYGYRAFEAFLNGDYQLASYLSYQAWRYYDLAQSVRLSTKVDWDGFSMVLPDKSHEDLHEPPVWSLIPSACKTN